MKRESRWCVTLVLVLGVAGCARVAGPPPIAADAVCATCGMSADSPRYTCERVTHGKWRVYDSIECLLQDVDGASATTIWLHDYDQRALHRADSLWIVKGALATPMGGGLVAFQDRGAADAVARSSHGEVVRWASLASPTRTPR